MSDSTPTTPPAALVPTVPVPYMSAKKQCTCGKTIYMVRGTNARTGKPTLTPVDVTIVGACAPIPTRINGGPRDGLGVNHFKNCPDAGKHNRRNAGSAR